MERWEYLISKEYRLRHHICEYYLNDIDYIIDIGAYKKTLNGNNVIPIDPLMSMNDSYHGTVAQWFKEHGDILNNNYAVVALGLEIEGGNDEWDSFISLLDGAKIAILEHSIEHEPSVLQFEKIMSITKKKIVTLMEFEFCNIDVPGFTPHKKRKLIILERK